MRRSENLCEGRCFKRLIVQVTHHLFLLCLEVCAISRWSEQLQQLISVLTFIILPSLPCPASWGAGGVERTEKKETYTCILEDQSDLIWSHSWGCYGDGQFWSLGCRHHWCWGKHWLTELWPDGCRESQSGSCLRKRLACSAHSPHSCKAFLMKSQPFHTQMRHYLTLLSMLRAPGGVLFPLCSKGPYNDALKKSTICLWGSWIQLIWRGAQFLLW